MFDPREQNDTVLVPRLYCENGVQVREGDHLKDFRDEEWIFIRLFSEGRGWKVLVKKEDGSVTSRIFFLSVFNLHVELEK